MEKHVNRNLSLILSFDLVTAYTLQCHFIHWMTEWDGKYRKPPNISPGLIFVRKHFWWAYTFFFGGGGLYTGGLIYGQDFALVILTIY